MAVADPAPLHWTVTNDAYAQVKRILAMYGLAGMDDWIRTQLVIGSGPDAVAIALRETPQFRQRFSVIENIRKRNLENPNDPRHVPTPEEVLEYEKAATQMLRAAGLPVGFYDEARDIQKIMEQDVSLNELQSRVENGYLRVAQAPVEVRDAFARFFGAAGDGALAAMFLDPERAAPALEKMVAQSQIAGAGVRFGLHIDQPRAARVSDLGLSQEAVESGLSKVQELGSLFGQTVGEAAGGAEALTAEGEGLGAAFDLDPESKAKVQRRLGEREAAFGGQAGTLQERAGLTGLGSARR